MAEGESPRGLWLGLGAVVLVVLALIAWSFLPSTPGGPSQPTALPKSVLERATPVVQKTAVVTTSEVPADMKARRDAREMPSDEAEPKIPTLRSNEDPVPPYDISRVTQRTGDMSRAGPLRVDARYAGSPVPAHVVVDGVYRGDSPLNLELPPGEHVIRLDYAKTRVNEFSAIATRGYNIKLGVDLRQPNQLGPNKVKGKIPKAWRE